jgi:hypothetical protein
MFDDVAFLEDQSQWPVDMLFIYVKRAVDAGYEVGRVHRIRSLEVELLEVTAQRTNATGEFLGYPNHEAMVAAGWLVD